MQDFKINHLRAFVSIIEQGGFHAAAKFMHKTQPAITQSVRTLESDLNQTLFIKGNKIKLTSFGESFFAHAKDLIDYHDNIRRIVFHEQKSHYKNLTVATLPSIAQSFFPKIIKPFLKANPEIYLTIRDTNSHQIERLLEDSKIDFAISAINENNKNIAYSSLLQDRFGLVVHKNHELSKAKSINWDEACRLPLIQNGTWRVLPYEINHKLQLNSIMSIVNMNALNAALESQVGATILPKFAFNKAQKELVFIKIISPKINRKIGIIWSEGKPISATSQLLIDFIQNSLSESS